MKGKRTADIGVLWLKAQKLRTSSGPAVGRTRKKTGTM